MVFAGTLLATVRIIGPFATMATGEKPATGSNGRLVLIAALVVKDDDSRQSVYPSGAALDTTAAPIEPPAPGRLSTITGTFHASESFFPTSRANVSFDPPGGYGTMIVTGFDGNRVCASAANDNAATRSTASHLIGSFSLPVGSIQVFSPA